MQHPSVISGDARIGCYTWVKAGEKQVKESKKKPKEIIEELVEILRR